jgi:hypothetical protein
VKKFYPLIFIFFIIISCGPSYKTEYRFNPPTTENGRMCINNCLMMNQQCRQNVKQCKAQCLNTYQSCQVNSSVIDVTMESLDRQSYKNNYHSRPHAVCSYPLSLCNDNCNSDCQSQYNMCYENCGGQVFSKTVCTRNCD